MNQPAADIELVEAPARHAPAAAPPVRRPRAARPLVIASILRPRGETGVRAHMRALLAAVAAGRREEGADFWPRATVITPFAARLRISLLIGTRVLIEPVFPSLAVRWYRTGHGAVLRAVLQRHLADGAPCIIYAQCPISAAAALAARAGPQQKVVLAVHFNVSQADEWAYAGRIASRGRDFYAIRAFEARWLPQVDALIFVSHFMRKVLLERLPMLARVRHAIVPNFVAPSDAEPLAALVGREHAFDADLISIGALEPRKNQAAQLDIIAAARRLGAGLTLTMVGDGPERRRLEARARALGIVDLVRFTGYVPDAARLLTRHRALLHTANVENMPIAPLEALAAGRPVLAVAGGGTGELFDDGVEGLALAAKAPRASARRIIALLADPARLADMGAAARARHAAHYTPRCVARQLLDFLEQTETP